jgi:hypothetical protein
MDSQRLAGKVRLQVLAKWEETFAVDTFVIERANLRDLGPTTRGATTSLAMAYRQLLEPVGPDPVVIAMPAGERVDPERAFAEVVAAEAVLLVSPALFEELGGVEGTVAQYRVTPGANDGRFAR